MTTEDRNKLLNVLHTGRETWLESLKGATNITQQPEPGKWSVLEIAEHVAVVEGRLLNLIRNSSRVEEALAADTAREDGFVEMISSRADRVAAPEVVLPTGAMKSLEEAIAAFEAARANSVAFVESGENLRSYTTKHMRFGQVSGYEMALIMAAHPTRHAKQVAEVRAAVKG